MPECTGPMETPGLITMDALDVKCRIEHPVTQIETATITDAVICGVLVMMPNRGQFLYSFKNPANSRR